MKIEDFPNYRANAQGTIINYSTGRALTPIIKNGYCVVRLSKNNKVYNKSLHRLIYEAFNGKIKHGMHIHHINGIKTDNSINNLKECTPKYNNDNRLFLRRGSDVNTSKFNESQIMEIREKRASGMNNQQIADMFNVNKSSIRRIVTGESWSHLPTIPYNDKWLDNRFTGSMSGKLLKEKYGDDYFSKISKGIKFKS